MNNHWNYWTFYIGQNNVTGTTLNKKKVKISIIFASWMDMVKIDVSF